MHRLLGDSGFSRRQFAWPCSTRASLHLHQHPFLCPVSSLHFFISMCTPLCIPTTRNDFRPSYDTSHWSFSDGCLYPSLDFAGMNQGWEEANCCPGSSNKVPYSHRTTLQVGPFSHHIQPSALWTLGHILYLDFISPGRYKLERALALLPPSQKSSSSSPQPPLQQHHFLPSHSAPST